MFTKSEQGSRVRVAQMPDLDREVWRLLTLVALVEQLGKLGWRGIDLAEFSQTVRAQFSELPPVYAVISPSGTEGFVVLPQPGAPRLAWMIYARRDEVLLGPADRSAFLLLWFDLMGLDEDGLRRRPGVLTGAGLPVLVLMAPWGADYRGYVDWVFHYVSDLGDSKFIVAVQPNIEKKEADKEGGWEELWAKGTVRPRWRVELRGARLRGGGLLGTGNWPMTNLKVWKLSGEHEDVADALTESGLLWWGEERLAEWSALLGHVRNQGGRLLVDLPLESFILLGIESPLFWGTMKFRLWASSL